MDLKEEFRKLIELQELDLKVFSLIKEKDKQIPLIIKEIEEKTKLKKEELNSLEESFKQVQLRKKDQEIELASKEESLRKAQTQLYQLKTNKEYQAKISEIGGIKSDISVAEDKVLKAMDEIEKNKNILSEKKSQLNTEQSELENNKSNLQNRIAEIEGLISDLKAKRNRISSQIDKNVLEKYERLLLTRDGLAVVAVKNSICGACYMKVTHQKINHIKMYSELVFCENCVRILYIPEDIPL